MEVLRLARALAAASSVLLFAGCAMGPLGAQGPIRSDAAFAQVAAGMTEPEVAQMLGRPDESMRFPLSGNEAWDYRYFDTWGYLAIFSVTFGPDHRVVSTISNRINSGGDHGGGSR